MRRYSMAEIAEALDISKQAAQKRANKEGWPSEKSGRGMAYPFDTLPADVQAAITVMEARAARKEEAEQRKALAAPSPAATGTAVAVADAFKPRVNPTPGVITKGGQTRRAKPDAALDDKSRRARDAALIVCRVLDDAIVATDSSPKAACKALAERFVRGEALPDLTQAIRDTQTKPRRTGPTVKGVLRHLQRMYALYLEGCKEGNAGGYLVPGKREKEGHNPLHIRAFLMFWCNPNKPSVSVVYRDGMVPYLTAQGLKPPSYSTVCAIENSLPVTVKYRGRMTGSAYRALLPYISRDVSMFKANDIWVGDGHSFKARVQSPIHGNAFVPEVTVIIDWVSRKVVGWSVALSESTIAVSDAFRDAQRRTRARPLIYYSDNGSGQTGKHIDQPITGTLSRQGIAHETGRPGNPQGRGVIERWWPTVLIPLAATYPTFTGKKADKETVRKIGNEVARLQRAGESAPLLPSFGQFLIDLEQAIEHYNTSHVHSELNGMTPNAAYEAKLDPDSIGAVSDAELEELWMPEEIRTPQRGVVSLFNNEYFLRDMVDELAEGEQVRVRFDIHDASRVRVLRMNGTLLGVAEWNGNKRAAFPVAYVEQKRIERADGIKGRAQENIDRADAELTRTFSALPEPAAPEIELSMQLPGENACAEVLPGPAEAEIARNRRINQMEDPALARHLAAHPEDINELRARYLLEQAEKIAPLARLVDELEMWGTLKRFEKRVATS